MLYRKLEIINTAMHEFTDQPGLRSRRPDVNFAKKQYQIKRKNILQNHLHLFQIWFIIIKT
jgi:hypothetical protein